MTTWSILGHTAKVLEERRDDYTRDDGIQLIYLEALGSHENFYRDLKR